VTAAARSAGGGAAGGAAIVGLAELAPVRDTGAETELSLAAVVGAAALADAGLGPGDADGLLVHPMDICARLVPSTVGEYLGLDLGYGDSVDLGGASAVGMLWRAAAAIERGLCSVCLCITAVPRSRDTARPGGPTRRAVDVSPWREFEVPYGNIGATEGYALIATRYEQSTATRPWPGRGWRWRSGRTPPGTRRRSSAAPRSPWTRCWPRR
jgi:hypothetical protein